MNHGEPAYGLWLLVIFNSDAIGREVFGAGVEYTGHHDCLAVRKRRVCVRIRFEENRRRVRYDRYACARENHFLGSLSR